MSDFNDKSLKNSGLDRYIRRLDTGYFLATVIVGTLAIALFVVMFAQINSQGRYATLIAGTGRQRALVQRTTLFSLLLAREPDPRLRSEGRANITRALADLERVRSGLPQGEAARDLPGHPGNDSAPLDRDSPADLDRRIDAFAGRARSLVVLPNDAPLDPRSDELAAALEADSEELLAALDTVIGAYEQANRRKTRELQAVEASLVLVLLGTSFAGLKFAFRPLKRATPRESGVQSTLRHRDEGGERDGAAGVFSTLGARDVSARVEADGRFAARDAPLDAARARGEFVASVSHELRAPMNNVLEAADLLGATGLNVEQKEWVETIRTSGHLLLAIVDDVLDFSKLEAGKVSLEAIELDLRQLVESTADVLAGRALQKQLELIVYIEPRTPTQLIGDPARVRQVLLHLLSNAIAFTTTGEIVLRVHCGRADDRAATLRFSVQDTGVGIDPATRGRLFHAFGEADAAAARHLGGTGLGLTISRQLVELMGGEIGVDGVPGKGSTFWFTADFALNQSGDDALDRENPSLEGLRGARVLIVDDNATLRRLVQQRLAAWEMVADTAEDAAHTLTLMREKMQAGTPYDLVLLDLNLGSIDGFTLAWAITNQPLLANARLILVTSLGVESDRHACAQVGIRASVTKPLKYHTLLNTMAQVMADSDPGPATAGHAAPEMSFKPKPIESHHVRVLLAEDNAINRKLALRQLANLGYHADVVENGLEALAALDAGTYDVVLLDMHMPVMDGCQAAISIRQHETQLGKRRQTLIALTANTSGGDREKCLSSGMDDFLGKPVRQDELAKTLARWAPNATAHVAAKK